NCARLGLSTCARFRWPRAASKAASSPGPSWTPAGPFEPRRAEGRRLGAAHPQRQALEEVAQQLVAARTEVAVPGLAEQCRHLRLGYRMPRIGKDLVHVDVGQLERHAQLLQHDVVA